MPMIVLPPMRKRLPNPYKKKTAQKRRTAQKGRSYVFGIPTPTSPAHHNENHPIFRAGARVPATSSTRDRDIGDPTKSHNSKRRSNAWIIFLAIGIFMLLITAYLLCRRKVVPATQNFNIENRLGQGGFGPVYKGTLASGSEMLIVYEFMPNRSLDAHLFDLTNRSVVPLDWETHFGLAKLLKDNQSEANTTTKVGTFGYMAPEYCMGGVISSKSDVYSFGVVLLEIISGLKSLDPRLDCLGLPNHTWELWCRRSGIELMDKAMAQSSVDSEEVLRWIHIDAEAGLSVDSVNLVTSQSSSNVASNNTPILEASQQSTELIPRLRKASQVQSAILHAKLALAGPGSRDLGCRYSDPGGSPCLLKTYNVDVGLNDVKRFLSETQSEVIILEIRTWRTLVEFWLFEEQLDRYRFAIHEIRQQPEVLKYLKDQPPVSSRKFSASR
ncbi:hypothetical protein Q3G72_002649 [Acer saccharum]|nr:hypothetical protein Q3G72_002649 [Acer saccharum]